MAEIAAGVKDVAAARTVRAVVQRFSALGLLERINLFPPRYRWVENVPESRRAYVKRLEDAAQLNATEQTR